MARERSLATLKVLREDHMQSLSIPKAVHGLNVSGLGQLGWFAVGALVAFLFPFVFSSIMELGNDLYYAIYFSGAIALLTIYSITAKVDVRALFSRNWRWSLCLGILAAVFLVLGVIQREDSTPHPDGLYFAFTIAWRGVAYGVVDALVLTAFPVAVAYAVFHSRLDSLARKAGFAALAMILSLTITATYHLGYEQFRDDGITGPETGNAIISLPAVLTANPLGSLVAHASMHVAADIHAYETDLYLPPETTVDE
jgi:hypothetical protein